MLKENSSLLRQQLLITGREENQWQINHVEHLNFSSNDYLQLAKHPDIIQAFIQGAMKYGVSSSSSPQICGYTDLHFSLETAICEFLNRDKALLFNSGYSANNAVLTSFAQRRSIIIADKYCHASLIDGARLSGAKLLRYHHQDWDHANYLAEKHLHAKKIFVTESIFSMQGNITDLYALSTIAKKQHGFLIVDAAHSIGMIGEQGEGIGNYENINPLIDCLITPFGKALGGFGAAVSGKKEVIDTLLQTARSYRYSTALSPAICAALLVAFHLIQTETFRREKLNILIKFFKQCAAENSLPFLPSDSHIQCLLLKTNEFALYMQKFLLQKNLLTACIRPPTVPMNSARIRITLNCSHSQEDILLLLKEMKVAYELYRKNTKKF